MQIVFEVERNKDLQRTEVLVQQAEWIGKATCFHIDDCIDSRWVHKDREYVSLIIRKTVGAITALAKAEGEDIEISIRHRD